MKKYIVILLLLWSTNLSFAQVDRSIMPEAKPASEIELENAVEFELRNGLRVFVVENHKLPKVNFFLRLDTKPILEGDKAGYVSASGSLMMGGTEKRSKEELNETVDFLGASLNVSASSASASSLSKYKEEVLELMAEVILQPKFSQEELDKWKTETKSNLLANREDNSDISNNINGVVMYGKDHPYGELMDETSVDNITLEDCKNYYNNYYRPNIAYLVVMGDIKVREAKKLVRKYFRDWDSKEVKTQSFIPVSTPENTDVTLVDRSESSQSLIKVNYPIDLKKNSEDLIKLRVLNQILGGGSSGRLFQNLREDKGYTYGAYSSYSSDDLVGYLRCEAESRTAVTDSAVHEFLYELRKIQEGKIDEQTVEDAKSYLTGAFARSLESQWTIANFALNTVINGLDENYYKNYLKNLNAVTAEDLQEIAQKYIKPENAHIVIVGDTKAFAKKMKRFGKVTFYDLDGNTYEPKKMTIPEGLTGEMVIEKYIEAQGGKEKLASVRNKEIIMSSNINGQKLDIISFSDKDKGFYQSTSMGEMVFQKTFFDGEKGYVEAQGEKNAIPEEDIEATKNNSQPFAELHYKTNGVKTELKGIEDVNDENAYLLEITRSTEDVEKQYFDTDSGLLLKQVKVIESPMGTVSQVTYFLDYKEIEGVKYPMTIETEFGPQKIKMILESVKTDIEVPAYFK